MPKLISYTRGENVHVGRFEDESVLIELLQRLYSYEDKTPEEVKTWLCDNFDRQVSTSAYMTIENRGKERFHIS